MIGGMANITHLHPEPPAYLADSNVVVAFLATTAVSNDTRFKSPPVRGNIASKDTPWLLITISVVVLLLIEALARRRSGAGFRWMN